MKTAEHFKGFVVYSHTMKKRSLFIQKSDIVAAKYSINFIWYFLNSHLSETWETDMSFVFLLLILTAETRQSSVSWSKKSHIRVPLYKLTWEQDWCTHWCRKIITNYYTEKCLSFVSHFKLVEGMIWIHPAKSGGTCKLVP